MSIELTIEDNLWLKNNSETDWQQLFEKLSSRCGAPQETQINVILTNDIEIQLINKQHRGVDKSTNVLSFPLYTREEINTIPNIEKMLLGDIVLAYNTMINEASTFGKTLYDRVAHLFVHGVLHILGYDHETTTEQAEMESLEVEILSFFKIENPYISGSNT